MAYIKTDWKARKGSNLNRHRKENETSQSVILHNEPTSVTEPGTPFSTQNMNKIEDGIYSAHEMIAKETEALVEHNENSEAHPDIRETINTKSEELVAKDQALEESINTENKQRVQAVQLLQETQTLETQNRENKDQYLQGEIAQTNNNLLDLQNDFNAWIGRGGFLNAVDFGTAAPSQQQLTDYALSQITNIENPTLIWNGTRVNNLFNGHTWILTNTPDTEPPIFEWNDNGPTSIAPFDKNRGGFIVGGDPIEDGPEYVEAMPNGKGRSKTARDSSLKGSGISSDPLGVNEKAVFLMAHPVNSLYFTISADESTASLMAAKWGGTWTAWGQGRSPLGIGSCSANTITNYGSLAAGGINRTTVGERGGAVTHQLTAAQSGVPAHNHPPGSHTHSMEHTHEIGISSTNRAGGTGYQNPGMGQGSNKWNTDGASASNTGTPTANNTGNNTASGASEAHNNIHPYETCYIYLRTT